MSNDGLKKLEEEVGDNTMEEPLWTTDDSPFFVLLLPLTKVCLSLCHWIGRANEGRVEVPKELAIEIGCI